ncbi:hypothetical protein [Ideonella sp.]|uniref:hypothetical protein n=1 Tax=Ideonella sp. TaxID=1929293 RepID=UPI002B49DA84|nr:hypothetical protein [Ideonella sp.]HJV72250.1 hypothetical protein [Ideonella sp.]
MSTLTHPSMSFARPRRRRAASLKQVLRQQLATWGGRVWAALETAGRLRAAPYLLQEARLIEASDPALAAALRQTTEPTLTAARATTPTRAH